MIGNVYLLVQIDENGLEVHKIGITKNEVETRICQLQTGNSNQIRLLDYYSSENYRKIEHMLHRRFFSNKTLAKNEWFNLPDDFILRFKEECKKTDELITFMKANNPFYK